MNLSGTPVIRKAGMYVIRLGTETKVEHKKVILTR